MMEWRNQVAVVTGGARGLGRATARLLAQRGAAVCVNYAVHVDAAEAVAAQIATAGGRAIAVAADVADSAAVEAMVARTELLTTFGVSRRCCFSNVTSGQNAGARVIRVRRSELGHYPRAPTEAALHGPVVDGDGSLALGRRLRPSARKLDQDLFLVFGFGLADPTLRFLGILPELISL